MIRVALRWLQPVDEPIGHRKPPQPERVGGGAGAGRPVRRQMRLVRLDQILNRARRSGTVDLESAIISYAIPATYAMPAARGDIRARIAPAVGNHNGVIIGSWRISCG